jgi:voltage-gated potassium channel
MPAVVRNSGARLATFASVDLRLLKKAAIAWLCLISVGTLGFHTLGGKDWTWLDSLYMTVTTIATVGYGEIHDLSGNTPARVFAIVLIVLAFAVVATLAASLTAAILEGRLSHSFRRRRNMKALAKLQNHHILCGLGETGISAARELRATGKAFVGIEPDEAKMEHALRQVGEFPYVVGDPTHEEMLEEAGIAKAAGLLVATNDDRVNVFLVITARGLNPQLRIVARAVDPQTQGKLRRAGATVVVAPNALGGLRLASEMIRPRTTSFLDRMLYHSGGDTRMDEAEIPEGSRWVGKSLGEADIAKATGVVPVAIDLGEDKFLFNPTSEHVLQVGQAVIAVGSASEMERLRSYLAG